MSYALVQGSVGNINTGGVTTVATAYSSNNTAGNLLIGVTQCFSVGGDDSQSPSMGDTAGNTWLLAKSVFDTNQLARISIYYVQSCLSGANTVTFTESGAVFAMQLNLLEYSGNATTSILDGTPTSATRFSTQIQIDPGAITTGTAGSLVLGAVSYDNSATTSGNPLSAGSGYTRQFDDVLSGNRRMAMEDQISGSAGSYDALWDSVSTSGIFVTVAAAFKPLAVGGSPQYSSGSLLFGIGR